MRTKGATSLTKIKFVQLLAMFDAEDDIIVGRKFLDAAQARLRAKPERAFSPTRPPADTTIG